MLVSAAMAPARVWDTNLPIAPEHRECLEQRDLRGTGFWSTASNGFVDLHEPIFGQIAGAANLSASRAIPKSLPQDRYLTSWKVRLERVSARVM
jgi:hypothetical protein